MYVQRLYFRVDVLSMSFKVSLFISSTAIATVAEITGHEVVLIAIKLYFSLLIVIYIIYLPFDLKYLFRPIFMHSIQLSKD